jgi:LmbE family N-acetylglucosaminyl deacetylase
MTSAVTPRADVERVLVITAHPDDVDYGASGTVATWTRAGIEVRYVIATSGDAGGFDDDFPRAEMAALREREQRDAAAAVGVTEVTFLHYPDGQLYPTLELRRDLSREIRRFKPQRVLTQSPEINWERIYASHPDHRATGEAALNAVYPDARNPYTFPELREAGFEAWTVPELWMMAGTQPNHYVDVTDTLDAKIAALRAHKSQTAHNDRLEDMIRGWLTANAHEGNLPEGRLAEAFHLINTA